MNLWWMIFAAGAGTYLMRSAGVWLPPQLVPTRWLTYLPLAVILVMAIASLSSFTGSAGHLMGAIAATVAVVIASMSKLPLYACIAIGCGVFGLLG